MQGFMQRQLPPGGQRQRAMGGDAGALVSGVAATTSQGLDAIKQQADMIYQSRQAAEQSSSHYVRMGGGNQPTPCWSVNAQVGGHAVMRLLRCMGATACAGLGTPQTPVPQPSPPNATPTRHAEAIVGAGEAEGGAAEPGKRRAAGAAGGPAGVASARCVGEGGTGLPAWGQDPCSCQLVPCQTQSALIHMQVWCMAQRKLRVQRPRRPRTHNRRPAAALSPAVASGHAVSEQQGKLQESLNSATCYHNNLLNGFAMITKEMLTRGLRPGGEGGLSAVGGRRRDPQRDGSPASLQQT